MCGIPDAKRVHRSDIYNLSPSPPSSASQSRSSSPARNGPDPEIEKRLLARLAEIYGPVAKPATSNASGTSQSVHQQKLSKQAPNQELSGPQEIEFRLFSTPSINSPNTVPAQTQKILLDVEIGDSEIESALVRKKPRSYYFSAPFPNTEKYVAVTGEDILEWSRRRNWGLEVGWRVTILKDASKQKLGGTAIVQYQNVGVVAGQKTKPNKKGRIKLRKKMQEARQKQERDKKERALKDETEKEKKARRNREKKLKRRAKEKVEKLAKRAGGGNIEVVGAEGLDASGSGSD